MKKIVILIISLFIFISCKKTNQKKIANYKVLSKLRYIDFINLIDNKFKEKEIIKCFNRYFYSYPYEKVDTIYKVDNKFKDYFNTKAKVINIFNEFKRYVKSFENRKSDLIFKAFDLEMKKSFNLIFNELVNRTDINIFVFQANLAINEIVEKLETKTLNLVSRVIINKNEIKTAKFIIEKNIEFILKFIDYKIEKKRDFLGFSYDYKKRLKTTLYKLGDFNYRYLDITYIKKILEDKEQFISNSYKNILLKFREHISQKMKITKYELDFLIHTINRNIAANFYLNAYEEYKKGKYLSSYFLINASKKFFIDENTYFIMISYNLYSDNYVKARKILDSWKAISKNYNLIERFEEVFEKFLLSNITSEKDLKKKTLLLFHQKRYQECLTVLKEIDEINEKSVFSKVIQILVNYRLNRLDESLVELNRGKYYFNKIDLSVFKLIFGNVYYKKYFNEKLNRDQNYEKAVKYWKEYIYIKYSNKMNEEKFNSMLILDEVIEKFDEYLNIEKKYLEKDYSF